MHRHGAETKIMNHPCFDADASLHWARVHLPVAPECNIVCAYCDRRYDCVNESRPGVASSMMTPEEACRHLRNTLTTTSNTSVAGIAGPGDPMATPETTLAAIRLIGKMRVNLCLSTNGLNLAEYVPELKHLGVGYVTLTINAVDPVIGGQICLAVRYRGKTFTGSEGAAFLFRQQTEALVALKRYGMTVKINTVVIPGINDTHVIEIARFAAAYRADYMNCLGLIPLAGTPMSDIHAPTPAMMQEIRNMAGLHIRQMRHCARCRADASGLLSSVKATAVLHDYPASEAIA